MLVHVGILLFRKLQHGLPQKEYTIIYLTIPVFISICDFEFFTVTNNISMKTFVCVLGGTRFKYLSGVDTKFGMMGYAK